MKARYFKGSLILAVFFLIFGWGEISFSQSSHPIRDRILERIRQRNQQKKEEAQDPGSQVFTLTHEGKARTYRVYVPSSYNLQAAVPVVVVLHGGGEEAKSMEQRTGMDLSADRYGFIAVYPQGTGPQAFGKIFGTWNAGRCCGAAMKNKVDDVGFISRMLDQLSEKFKIDPNRIYATGHSNGSQMSYRLACELSERIAAIAPVGGQGVFESCSPARAVSVIHFHGTEDRCALYHGGDCGRCFEELLQSYFPVKLKPTLWPCDPVPDSIGAWAKRNHLPPQSKLALQSDQMTCISYGSLKNSPEVRLCTIEGMGHTWPGGGYGPACDQGMETPACQKMREVLGELNNEISANEIMWDFFERHPKQEDKH